MRVNNRDRQHPPRHWTESAAWQQRMAAVLGRHMLIKAVGTTLFISVFFVAYFHLLRNPAYPATVMPTTWLDRAIPFEPLTLPIYLSLWLYVSLPPALLWNRRELLEYGMAIGLTCLTGLSIFYFWPTLVPEPDIDWASYPSVAFLKGMDATGNASPSLHVATAVFSAMWMHLLLRRYQAPTWLAALNWLWCAAIIYSTLSTRQHVVVDVLSGAVLGALGAYLSARWCQPAGLSVEAPNRTRAAPEVE